MEIEAQWGVQYEQQIYKKTRSEKENSQAKINSFTCWLGEWASKTEVKKNFRALTFMSARQSAISAVAAQS